MMFPDEFYRSRALNALLDALLGRDKKKDKKENEKDDDKKEEPSPKKPAGPVIGFRDQRTGKWTDLSGFGGFYR